MADMSRRPVVLEPLGDGNDGRLRVGAYEIEGSTARSRFREFFRNFRLGNVYLYRDALIRHWNRGEYFVEVDLAHVHEYDEVLLQSLQVKRSPKFKLLLVVIARTDAFIIIHVGFIITTSLIVVTNSVTLQCLQTRPTEILPFFEAGAKDALRVFLTQQGAEQLNDSTVPDFQVILVSSEKTQSLRNLTAEHVNRLLKVPGIVISCSRLRVKANLVVVRCTVCGTLKVPVAMVYFSLCTTSLSPHRIGSIMTKFFYLT
jgi:DNA replication licensing factor MCM5